MVKVMVVPVAGFLFGFMVVVVVVVHVVAGFYVVWWSWS